jgi:hypothetical protein
LRGKAIFHPSTPLIQYKPRFPDLPQQPIAVPNPTQQNLPIRQLGVAIHALPLAMTKGASALAFAPRPPTARRASLIPHFRRLSPLHSNLMFPQELMFLNAAISYQLSAVS